MGRPGAFDEFFRREFDPLVSFLRKAGFGQEPARDAAAEAMTCAYEGWTTITSAPKAWVRRAAYRIALREARRAREGTLRAAAGGWAISTHYKQDVVEVREEHDELLELLDRLPRRQRLVMSWHLDGFDTNEISEQLRMPPATVRSTLRHARRRLLAEYEEKTVKARKVHESEGRE